MLPSSWKPSSPDPQWNQQSPWDALALPPLPTELPLLPQPASPPWQPDATKSCSVDADVHSVAPPPLPPPPLLSLSPPPLPPPPLLSPLPPLPPPLLSPLLSPLSPPPPPPLVAPLPPRLLLRSTYSAFEPFGPSQSAQAAGSCISFIVSSPTLSSSSSSFSSSFLSSFSSVGLPTSFARPFLPSASFAPSRPSFEQEATIAVPMWPLPPKRDRLFDNRTRRILNAAYRENRFASGTRADSLAVAARLTREQVVVWFKNKRQRERKRRAQLWSEIKSG